MVCEKNISVSTITKSAMTATTATNGLVKNITAISKVRVPDDVMDIQSQINVMTMKNPMAGFSGSSINVPLSPTSCSRRTPAAVTGR